MLPHALFEQTAHALRSSLDVSLGSLFCVAIARRLTGNIPVPLNVSRTRCRAEFDRHAVAGRQRDNSLDQRQRFAYRTKQQIAFNRSLRKFAWHDAARKQRPHFRSEKESFE